MTPTEISEHAKEAALWRHDTNATVSHAIQHGINLAVESKDKRIAELEAHCEGGRLAAKDFDALLQSKDREIERLKLGLENSHQDGRSIYAQLTEANAKLAEAEERLYGGELWASFCENVKDDLTEKLSSAQAEIERLKGALNQIFDETDPYADGAPDSGAMPLLANQISGIVRPFVK